MNKYFRFATFGSIVFVITLVVFVGSSSRALAVGTPEAIKFRIDTELDVLNDKGVTVTWSCNGTSSGSVTEAASLGVASDSDQTLNGVITVASASAENGPSESACRGSTGPMNAVVSINGWVTRRWTAINLASQGNGVANPFGTGASMDYDIVVTGVSDKLGYPLTFDGVLGSSKHASASYSGTVASSSYSNSKLYIAGSTFGGTVAASANGYVRRASSALTISATASQSVDFGTTNNGMVHATGLDYNLALLSIRDELGNSLTISNTVASASFSGTTASISYYGGKKYFAATSSGTVTAGDDGYVNEISSAISFSSYTNYSGASASLDFDNSIISTYDGTPLPFGHKIQSYVSGGTFAANPITSGGVTAGDSYGTVCTGSSGYWYCPVPLANTETSAKYISSGWTTTYATYADRSSGGDAQTTGTLIVAPSGGGGSSGSSGSSSGGSYLYSPVVSTPTPSVTPEITPTPTILPSYSPMPTPTIFILSPSPASAKLYRKASDPKVYVMGGDGRITWIKTLEEFNAAGFKWENVQVISGSEFAKLGVKSYVGVRKGVIWLNVRKTPSLKGAIVGKIMPNDVYEKTGQSGPWLKINYKGAEGWIHSAYTVNK